MKEKIKKILPILIIILIVLGSAFYWYEWRPSQIRKKCFYEVLGDKSISNIRDSGIFRNRFQACLAKYGIER